MGAEGKEQFVQRIENLVRKAKLYCRGAEEVECRVHAPHIQGQPFMVEVYEARYTRRVQVDAVTLQHLNLGQPDPALMRDLRTAIMAVHRLATRR